MDGTGRIDGRLTLAPAPGAAESALDPVRRLGAYIEQHFGSASHPLEGRLSLNQGQLSATGLRLQGNGAWLIGEARLHTVQSGDTLTSLAGRYFRGLPRASGFWWVIADYQPAPITDPTLALSPGTVLVIPSPGTLTGVILADRRRRIH